MKRPAGARTEVTVETGRLAADAVRTMFDRIAPVYDVMNRAMTAGLDRRWRAETARAVVSPGDRVLDACCGTGDLAIAAQRAGGKVIGLDFSSGCWNARGRSPTRSSGFRATRSRCRSRTARSTPLRLGSASATSKTWKAACASCGASSRPGGRVGILEITRPRGLLRPFYKLWFDGLVPLAGKLLPGGSAYTYLPASVRRFPGAEGARRADADRGIRAGALPPLRRRDRRTAHWSCSMRALTTIHETEGLDEYLEEIEQRLPDAVSCASGAGGDGRGGGARGWRQAAAPAARLPRRDPQPRAAATSPASPSSSCIWRRSFTTT